MNVDNGGKAPRAVVGAFLALALVVVLLPSVGMIWARTDTTGENRELAAAPSLVNEDGSANVDFLADAGAYFDDHFAYRNQAVAANAHLRAALGASATDQVVIGSDDWLYYGGTLNDYLGRSALSDRSLANVAHNLKIAQGYAENKGATFLFCLAPNKNTLYDEHMPAHFLRSPEASNAERLVPFLEAADVRYVNLFDLLERQQDVLYLQRDTHWDNRGAILAADELLQALGKQPASAATSQPVQRDDFVGDLQSMLYPGEARTEANYYYPGFHEVGDTPLSWRYVEGKDVEESWVKTSGAGEGGLLMFRDSFGNALLPFFAGSFEHAAFSKLVPYNMPELTKEQADCVVIERAERHLSDLATAPPIVPCPSVTFKNGLPPSAEELQANLECKQSGSYWVVRGRLDASLDPDARLYLSVQPEGSPETFFNPYWISFQDESGQVVGDNGLLAYIPSSAVDAGAATLRVYRG